MSFEDLGKREEKLANFLAFFILLLFIYLGGKEYEKLYMKKQEFFIIFQTSYPKISLIPPKIYLFPNLANKTLKKMCSRANMPISFGKKMILKTGEGIIFQENIHPLMYQKIKFFFVNFVQNTKIKEY